MRKFLIGMALIVCALFMAGNLSLADFADHPLQPVDVSSPRATLESFIHYSKKGASAYLAKDYSEAQMCVNILLQCFDLKNQLPDLREPIGFESVLYIGEIIHRIEIPPLDQIPDQKAVRDQKITSWSIPYTPITIGLVKDGSFNDRFVFTPETVKKAPEMYNKVKDLPYLWGIEGMQAYKELTSRGGLFIDRKFLNFLPGWAMTNLLGLRLWQWIGLIIFIFGGAFSIFLVYICCRRALDVIDRRFGYSLKQSVGGLIIPLGLILVSKLGLWFVIHELHIFNADVYLPTALTLLLFLYLGAIWLVAALLRRISEAVIFLGGYSKGGMDTQLIQLGFQIVALVVIAILAIDFGARLGLPTYSMVTGLGIGGLAVALAGREALSNLIGTVMIILDQPFKTGDYIVIGDGERGIVSEVGFRSTRVWTRDGILISIPNSTVANMKIVNQSAPVTVSRLHIPVGVAYGSNPDEVEEALLKVSSANEHVVLTPPPSVRFLGFGDSALNFALYCWVDHPEFRGRTLSKLNWEIYKEFQKRGIILPFPQRDVHIMKDQETSPQSESV